MVVRFVVPHPRRMWLATRKDVRDLVDPDLDDGHRRHADRDEVAWGEVADCLENIGQCIRAAAAADKNSVTIELDGPKSELARQIVQKWVEGAGVHGPRVSAHGSDQVADGRHRLWCCWQARPDAVLPVWCATLSSLDNLDDEPELTPAFRNDSARTRAEASMSVQERNPGWWELIKASAQLSYDGPPESVLSREAILVACASYGAPAQLMGVNLVNSHPEREEDCKYIYRTEAWRTNEGQFVVLVSDNAQGATLANATERILDAVETCYQHLSDELYILEDWSAQGPFDPGVRFVDPQEARAEVDAEQWERKGLGFPVV